MSIKWLTEQEAETLFDVTFMDWSTQYGYKGCYSDEETREEVVRARVWASGSRTAKEILNFVLASNKLIYVVGMRGGYQCFNSTEGPGKDHPVVFIDLDGKLTVNVRGPHNLHLDPNQCKGSVMHEGVPHQNKHEALNNWIALLHEFGHAKQWIETPSMFDNKKGQFDARLEKNTFAAAIHEKATARWKSSVCPTCGEVVDIDPTNRMMLDPKRDKEKNPKRLHICSGSRSPNALLPTAEEVLMFNEKTNPKGYKPPAWGAKIEMDNMSRHEWPICRDLGLPLRVNYRDINASSDGAASLTSQIRIKALAQARADETLKVQKPKVTAMGKVKCPRCGKMVLAKNVDKECGTFLHA